MFEAVFSRPLLALGFVFAGCAGDFDALKQKGDGYPLASTGETTGVAPTTSGGEPGTTSGTTANDGSTGFFANE